MDNDLAVRYLLGLVMLGGALIPDLRTRRVPNLWWVPFTAVAIVLLGGDLARGELGWPALATAGVLCAAFYGLWRLHLFGGADAKALMVLSLLVPNTPHPTPLPVPPAVDALANGSLLLVALPVAFTLYNLARGHVAPVMWLGVRMDLDAAERRHVWPMQVVGDDGQLRWRAWQRIGGEQATTYAALRRAGVAQVWATPKIPLVGALLLGLAVSWAWGDLVVRLAELATR